MLAVYSAGSSISHDSELALLEVASTAVAPVDELIRSAIVRKAVVSVATGTVIKTLPRAS